MITRYLNVVAILALVGSAAYAYSVKYETARYSADIVKARHDIQAERDTIAMLRAEWASLTRPDRVQALADRHLDLQSISIDQVVKVSDLPERASKVDSIGRKLEALGLSEPTDTPRSTGSIPRSATPAANH